MRVDIIKCVPSALPNIMFNVIFGNQTWYSYTNHALIGGDLITCTARRNGTMSMCLFTLNDVPVTLEELHTYLHMKYHNHRKGIYISSDILSLYYLVMK